MALLLVYSWTVRIYGSGFRGTDAQDTVPTNSPFSGHSLHHVSISHHLLQIILLSPRRIFILSQTINESNTQSIEQKLYTMASGLNSEHVSFYNSMQIATPAPSTASGLIPTFTASPTDDDSWWDRLSGEGSSSFTTPPTQENWWFRHYSLKDLLLRFFLLFLAVFLVSYGCVFLYHCLKSDLQQRRTRRGQNNARLVNVPTARLPWVIFISICEASTHILYSAIHLNRRQDSVLGV
jgi:hypothetical protein